MIEFIQETLLLLPFLFVTYLVLEAVEAKAGGALEKFLERARSIGPAAGMDFIPSDILSGELIPVLLSARAPAALMVKIVGIKVVCALGIGFLIDGILAATRHMRRKVSVHELCKHSHCGCHEHKGIFIPALIHTAEIFVFIVLISGAIELCMHCFGEDCLNSLRLNRPFLGELLAGVLGLIPNCAVSVAGAKLYLSGAMSPGALMASSFTGSGLGLLVLFRTNRNLKENLAILGTIYVLGVLLGWISGFVI